MIHEIFTDQLRIGFTLYEVEGKSRDWHSLPQHTPPQGLVWEVNTKHSGRRVYAAGSTKEEAMKNLREAITRAMDLGK